MNSVDPMKWGSGFRWWDSAAGRTQKTTTKAQRKCQPVDGLVGLRSRKKQILQCLWLYLLRRMLAELIVSVSKRQKSSNTNTSSGHSDGIKSTTEEERTDKTTKLDLPEYLVSTYKILHAHTHCSSVAFHSIGTYTACFRPCVHHYS